MTLLELQKRVAAVIAENDARGWNDRNHMPLGMELRRYGKKRANGRRSLRYEYAPIEYLSSSMESSYGATMIVTVEAADEASPVKNQHENLDKNLRHVIDPR
jgi:hypothetical protein